MHASPIGWQLVLALIAVTGICCLQCLAVAPATQQAVHSIRGVSEGVDEAPLLQIKMQMGCSVGPGYDLLCMHVHMDPAALVLVLLLVTHTNQGLS